MSTVKPTLVLSHWNKLVDNFQYSTDALYKAAEENLLAHQLKDVKIERVALSEGGMFSADREYLQVRRGEYVYHVCAAPYGNGFFVSSWLGHVDSGFWAWLSTLPIIGFFIRHAIKPLSFYRLDTAAMFQAVVHAAVIKAFDAALEAKGLHALTELDRKPAMRELWQVV